MSVNQSLVINRYYDFFRDKEIVFTKTNLQILGIDPRQIYIKCNGGQWPCIINSTSLMMVKVIIGTGSGAYSYLSKNKKALASIRYCFFDKYNEPISFFVNCEVSNISVYQNSQELALITLNFTQRPPDDLILNLGEFIDINENFKNKRFEIIEINKETVHSISLEKEESFSFIAKIPRRCILKELSFCGAKIMLVGIPKFLLNKEIDLRIAFVDSGDNFLIPGVIKEAESLEIKREIAVCQIEFNENAVPMSYKRHINTYLTTRKKPTPQYANTQAQKPVINTIVMPTSNSANQAGDKPQQDEKAQTPQDNVQNSAQTNPQASTTLNK